MSDDDCGLRQRYQAELDRFTVEAMAKRMSILSTTEKLLGEPAARELGARYWCWMSDANGLTINHEVRLTAEVAAGSIEVRPWGERPPGEPG